MKYLLNTFLSLFLAVSVNAQIYSNVLVEVNAVSELTALIVSAPFVWCRENNTLYYFNASTQAFTPYPEGGAGGVISVNTRTGAVTLTKADVGLTNADDTSDANKPISSATQTALNAKVNLTQPYGYTIDVQALTSSPVDGQTIFFGSIPRAPTTTAATSQVFIRKAGTIKAAQIYCFSGTAGTNESWSISIRLNNSTDTLIQTLGANTAVRVFTNSSLNIAVAAGDYIEIKSVNPTWGTNPLTTVFGGYIYIE